jgi:hypothetical protein
MKGRLKKINDKWVVEYTGVSYKGGNPKQLGSYTKKVEKKTLPLHPNFVTMTDYVWVKGIKVYDGDVVKFTEVLVNPMGREVDPKDLSQNHSKCVWYVRPYLDEKEEPKKVLTEEDIFNQKDIDAVTDYINKEQQKQHLIDIMESDEELGLYDESREIKLEDIFNDEKRENIKKFIDEIKNPSEPNQALKDAAERYQERSYSEEEVIAFGEFIFKHTLLAHSKGVKNLFEQFKKK